jgi:Arc/MetJ-type ribon-helix-helix transcriptional regulator
MGESGPRTLCQITSFSLKSSAASSREKSTRADSSAPYALTKKRVVDTLPKRRNSMVLSVSPDTLHKIEEQMTLGHYSSADDLLADALAALAERREDVEAIRAGIEDVEAGRFRPLTEIDAEIRAKHSFNPRT